MVDAPHHKSVHREIDAVKEAVALKAIRACAQWLSEHGHPNLAAELIAAQIEEEGDALPR